MGELIVITGDLAALKTTLCRRLQEAYQLKAIIKDDLKEMLYDNHPERDDDFIHTLSDVTFHEMVSMAKASPTPVLFEGNFKPHEIALIHQEFPRVLWFFVTASAKVRYARYLKREPSRHPAHKRYGTLS